MKVRMFKPILFGCGAALGAFVGLLVGMSASPVVASVVSGLIGVVAAYRTVSLGGNLEEASKQADGHRRNVEIEASIYLAGFSLFGIAALLTGLYLRTHNSLSPTPKQIVDQWTEAGLLPGQAQQVALNLFNTHVVLDVGTGMTIQPHAAASESGNSPPPSETATVADRILKEGGTPPSSGEGASKQAPLITTNTVLIAGDVTPCEDILGWVVRGDWKLAEGAFERAGGDWARRLDQLRGLPANERHQAMKSFALATCNPGEDRQ